MQIQRVLDEHPALRGTLVPDICQVIKAVDFLTGKDKQIVLLVDELAATRQVGETYGQLAKAADCLKREGKAVTVIATGLHARDWESAGVNWDVTASQRPFTWLVLQPAVDRASRAKLEQAFRTDILRSNPELGADDDRLRNLVEILLQYANGHWRTLEVMRFTLQSKPQAIAHVPNEAVRIEVEVVTAAVGAANAFWAATRDGTRDGQEAMAYLVACSVLREPIMPADEMYMREKTLVADWRFTTFELGGISGPPRQAAAFVPLFALPRIRTWCDDVLESPWPRPPQVIELARLNKELISLSVEPRSDTFEYAIALLIRLRLVARGVVESMRWRQHTGRFHEWPAAAELSPAARGGRDGKLWRTDQVLCGNARRGRRLNLEEVVLTSGFDQSETCPRLQAGDVIHPAARNPAFDVMEVIARDDGRLGLRLWEAKFDARAARRLQVMRGLVRKKLALLKSSYRGWLFASSEHADSLAASPDARSWSKLGPPVNEADVELWFATNGKCVASLSEDGMDGEKIRVNFTDGNDLAQLCGRSLNRLPMLRMQYVRLPGAKSISSKRR
jgi:hypothetical protein